VAVYILGYKEAQAWHMTPYKIQTLFKVHREFNPDKYKQSPTHLDDIDAALGGL
jgi:hypothetical protein